ncbi:hypothetical protein ACFL4T_12415, partial [candidate division KSB1 bacterium]
KRQYFFNQIRDVSVVQDSIIKDADIFQVRPQAEQPDKPVNIIRNGSLIRGFSLGTNQDLNIESGLRMQLEGEISSGVFLSGALTDQTSPIQPEGNTQTLKEIDKVFINLNAERFYATFGDFELHHKGGELSDIYRKLKGVSGGVRTESSNLRFSAAVSEGVFHTMKFLGTEGNQGPYQLKGKNGEINLIVLAGTEKVWIDGVLLTRGEDKDYIIDYSTGQVTFTRFRPVTQDSRIEMDFEYSIQDFSRNVLGVEGKTNIGRNSSLYISLFSESDKKDNPLNFTYSDEDLQMLQLAGDSTQNAAREGVFFKGSGLGNYAKVDSEGVIFFVYKGENLGEYDIRFSYVGSEKGDYVFESFGVYRYLGEGRGDYLPLIKLPVPVSRKSGSLKFDYQKENLLNFSTELGLSRNDLNTYSELHNDDDNGNALLLNLSTDLPRKKLMMFNDFQFNINGKYRYKDSRFNPIGRVDEVEFNRKWDYYGEIAENENILEITGNLSPYKTSTLTYEYGSMERGERFNSERHSLIFESKMKFVDNIFFRSENVKSKNNVISAENEWIRRKGSLNLNFKWFKPEIFYEGEEKSENIKGLNNYGFNFDDWAARLNFFSAEQLRLYVNTGLRKDKKHRESELSEDSDLLSRGFGIEYNNRKNFSSNLLWQSRERKYKIRDEKIENNLTDFRMQYSPLKRGLIFRISYKTSNNRTPLKERIYLKVEEGKGDYLYDEARGGYVPDRRGDLILRTLTTEKFRDIFQKSFSFFNEFKPSNFSKNSYLKNLELRTFLKLDERLKYKVLNPFKMFDAVDPVRSNLTFTQFFTYNDPEKGMKLSVKLNSGRNINNEFLDRQETRRVKETTIILENYFKNRFRNKLEFSTRTEEKEVTPFNRFNIDLSGIKFSDELFYRWKNNIEFHFRNQIGKEENGENDLKVTYFTSAPGVNFYFLNKGRAGIDLEYYRVSVKPFQKYIPYQMAEGRFPGNNYQLSSKVEYRISANISLNIYYNGEIRGGESRPYHIARGEIRAFF